MKKILLLTLAVMLMAGVASASTPRNGARLGDNGIAYDNVDMYGVDISTVMTNAFENVGSGGVWIWDIFVVKTTTATTGTVSIYDKYYDHAITFSVQATAATGSASDGDSGTAHSVCPWARNGYPVYFPSGAQVKSNSTSIDVYVLYTD